MSIILKGIDMPTDRKPYGIEVIYRFEGADGLFSEKNYLSPNQAIQIPKGHGRLIDADALEIVFKDMAKCEWNQKVSPISWAYAFEDTIDEIDNAPTILEAEE